MAENFDVYGKYHKLNKALLIGGSSMDEQIRILDRGADVLIATPGRLMDMFERGRLLLTDVKILVIDEADRMLDMGFIPDVERIVPLCCRHCVKRFFSATMPSEIKKLADKFLHNHGKLPSPNPRPRRIPSSRDWSSSRGAANAWAAPPRKSATCCAR